MDGLAVLQRGSPLIAFLRFHSFNISDKSVAILSTFAHLRLLDLQLCNQVTPQSLKWLLKGCPILQHLNLLNVPNVSQVVQTLRDQKPFLTTVLVSPSNRT